MSENELDKVRDVMVKNTEEFDQEGEGENNEYGLIQQEVADLDDADDVVSDLQSDSNMQSLVPSALQSVHQSIAAEKNYFNRVNSQQEERGDDQTTQYSQAVTSLIS